VKWFTILALALAIGLATAASPFASSSPDGLTRVAADGGFDARAKASAGPAAGYAIPGVGDERVAKGLAGFAGTLLVFAAGAGVARAVRR
jgi:PDGLE domain